MTTDQVLSVPRRLLSAVALMLTALITVIPWAPSRAAEVQSPAPVCAAPTEITRLDYVLQRTARRLAAGKLLTVVAFGSSSTAGAFASSAAASYPSRLAVELKARFPGRTFRVVNRGANGEDAREMVARMQQSVLDERPDLVLWQVGTNALLLDRPLEPAGGLIRDGVRILRAAGLDVVLIDPQFAPRVLAKADIGNLLNLYGTIAKLDGVAVFHRFEMMRHWREVAGIPFDVFLSPDELHMNDWSYACMAKLLANAIVEAATRSTQTATTTSPETHGSAGGR